MQERNEVKVKLYHLVMMWFAVINIIEYSRCILVSRRSSQMSTWDAVKEIISGTSSIAIRALALKPACHDDFKLASRAWCFKGDVATQWTWHLVKVRDIIRKKFAKRSRKWWMSSSKLKRAVKTGTI